MARRKISAFRAKFAGTCHHCGAPINVGDEITWSRNPGKKRYSHASCGATKIEPAPVEPTPAPVEVEPTPAPVEVEEVEPAPTPSVPSDLGRMLAEAVRPYLDAKADREEVANLVRDSIDDAFSSHVETVKALVADAVASQAPRVNVVEIKTTEGAKTIEGVHTDFASILETVQAGRSVGFSTWLHGKPGSGKSTIGRQVAEALGLPFYLLTLAPMSPPSALVGYGTADGRLVESDAYKAYTQGGVLVVEEIDNANDGVLTSFNAALANGHGSWPVVGTVAKHPDFVLIAAANTPGLGPTRAFPSRRRLDAAFRDRFVFLEVGYDLDLEERLTLQANPDARPWLATCRDLRRWTEENAPEIFVTPRSLFFGATLLRLGKTTREAVESTVFRGAEVDIVNRACAAVGIR